MIKKSVLLSLILVFVLAVLCYIFAPKPPLLENTSYSQAVYDRDGELLRLSLADDAQYRMFAPLDTISPDIIQATLLQEDQYFYYHPGVNPIALVRAAIETFITGDRRYGASTISMQLARIQYQLKTNTIPGKIKQIIYALQFERHYNKDEMLEAYLNVAPYGGNVSGVKAASLIYFSRTSNKVSLPEALSLSVIPQNPVKRRPKETINPALEKARNTLFQRWLLKYPNAINEQYAFNLPLQTNSTQNLPFLAPHFVDQLLKQYPNKTIINSTLDLQQQKLIEKAVTAYLNEQQDKAINNVAVLLINTKTMATHALLGSADFHNNTIQGQFNATQAKRSPGSSLKPFIFTLALQQGLITPMRIVKDMPAQFHDYTPENFDARYMGPITAQDGLIMSRNIPAVALNNQLNTFDLYDLLQASGINGLKSKTYYGLSIALGGVDISMQQLITLYAMLANGGKLKPIRMQVSDPLPITTTLLSPEASFITLDMLSKNPLPKTVATNFQQQGLNIAWKTGTSSAYRDAWTIGVVGDYALAVWLGDFSGKSNPAYVGRELASPLFFRIIQALNNQTPFAETHGLDHTNLNVTKVDVCKASGLLPTQHCPETIKTWFIPGVSSIAKDTIYREIAINPKSGMRSCDENTETLYKVYAYWPSDIQQYFKASGITQILPPPYEPSCAIQTQTINGKAPAITSPQANVTYKLTATNNKIALSAIADADVTTLYWFVDNRFISKSTPNHTVFWSAQRGESQLQVIDDYGRSDTIIIRAE